MVEQQRVALETLSEYTSCDEQRFCYPLFKQRMEQMVCRDLRMGETVRMHHVQWVPRMIRWQNNLGQLAWRFLNAK
jgi:hypothetical protein